MTRPKGHGVEVRLYHSSISIATVVTYPWHLWFVLHVISIASVSDFIVKFRMVRGNRKSFVRSNIIALSA